VFMGSLSLAMNTSLAEISAVCNKALKEVVSINMSRSCSASTKHLLHQQVSSPAVSNVKMGYASRRAPCKVELPAMLLT